MTYFIYKWKGEVKHLIQANWSDKVGILRATCDEQTIWVITCLRDLRITNLDSSQWGNMTEISLYDLPLYMSTWKWVSPEYESLMKGTL